MKRKGKKVWLTLIAAVALAVVDTLSGADIVPQAVVAVVELVVEAAVPEALGPETP